MKGYQKFSEKKKTTVRQINYVSILSLWLPKGIYGQKWNLNVFIVRIQLV